MKDFLEDYFHVLVIFVFLLVVFGLTFAGAWHVEELKHERIIKALEHGCPTED